MSRRLIAVHAHPDDETIGNGTTMARCVAEGGQVTLITCTLGEEGEVLVPALSMLGAEYADQLGGYRIGELAAACAELGVTDHRFLGGVGRYRDSGMMGLPANTNPRAFWQADVEVAAADLVQAIRTERPQVMLTYDDNGGYGHPDHIQAHRVAMRAAELAADPAYQPEFGAPWQIAKIYWGCVPRSMVQRSIDAMLAAGHEGMFGVSSAEDIPFAVDDDHVTARIDGVAYVGAKTAAMHAHASQIAADSPFFTLTALLGPEAFGVEFYLLAVGQAGPKNPETGWEDDLFAGLDLQA